MSQSQNFCLFFIIRIFFTLYILIIVSSPLSHLRPPLTPHSSQARPSLILSVENRWEKKTKEKTYKEPEHNKADKQE